MNITFLTSGTKSVIPFLRNSLINLNTNLNIQDKIVVICFDAETFVDLMQLIQARNYNNVYLYQQYVENTHHFDFGTSKFNVLTHQKFNAIIKLLEEGEKNVYFFDSDVHFFKSPVEDIQKTLESNNYDILFQQDAPITDSHKRGEPYVCTGNLVATEKSLPFLRKISSKFNVNQNDQEVLFQYLKENCPEYSVFNFKEINIGILDPELYQNGFDAFKGNWVQNPEKICVHANHHVGLQTKKDLFTKMNAWIQN